MLPGQLSLFPESATTPSTSMLGVLVTLPHACGCGSITAATGSSSGPHVAKLVRGNCGRFCGWLSAEAANFISSFIDTAADGLLSADTAIAVIAEAATRCGLPRSEATKTARSGVNTGAGHA